MPDDDDVASRYADDSTCCLMNPLECVQQGVINGSAVVPVACMVSLMWNGFPEKELILPDLNTTKKQKGLLLTFDQAG